MFSSMVGWQPNIIANRGIAIMSIDTFWNPPLLTEQTCSPDCNTVDGCCKSVLNLIQVEATTR
jgi:hypothetical protein